jgi:hypothetical protein
MRASGSLKAVRAFGLAVAAPGLGWTPPVHAQSTPAAPPGFWERSNLLDDLAGVRTALSKLGISYGLTSTDEVLGNVTGGVHTGADYDGLMQFGIGVEAGCDVKRSCEGLFFRPSRPPHGVRAGRPTHRGDA